jgi:hypothetical protein
MKTIKPFKLNKKQKENLLRMTSYYVNDKVSWYFWEDDGNPTDYIGHPHTIRIGEKNNNFPAVEIHWFEFCIKYLIPAMFGKNYYRQGNLIGSIVYKRRNPIDVLFEVFLKELEVHGKISDE